MKNQIFYVEINFAKFKNRNIEIYILFSYIYFQEKTLKIKYQKFILKIKVWK